MEIRELTEVDVEPYWDLRLRALREEPEAFGASYEEDRERPLERVRQRLAETEVSPDAFILGAFVEDDRLAGMIGLVRQSGAKVRHKALIWGMYVVPEERGRGLARRLLDETVRRAREMPGLEQLVLAVVTRNAPARDLYITAGFEVFGLEPLALKVGERYLDEEHMVLYLE